MNVRRVVLALASLLLLAQAIPASASPRIVRLSYLDGNVQIDRNRAAGVEHAILNMPVVEGTRILTDGDDARVEIEFENGSTLRLAGPGEIYFRQLGLIESGDLQTVVEVVRGIAYFDVKLHGDDDFRVMFHDRDVSLRKTSHFRVQVDDAETTVAVYRGEVQLDGASGRVLVKKDETLSLEANDQDRYFLARTINPFDTDQFDKERNDYRNTYARSNAYDYTGASYGSPYTYGVTDMASYGAYSYYPGYGYLWRPIGAAYGPGWDPFSYGAWSYYPQFGWVYVSSYPWGWTPYRYGQWISVPGYGWCWSPYGGVGRGWYPVPVVRHPYGPDGHGRGPGPGIHPPKLSGGPTIPVGGGGLTGRPEPPDIARRPGPAEGPHRPGRRTEGNPDPAVGPAATALAPSATGGLSTQGGAVLPQGGAVVPQGGAVTPRGGALTPVVPGREPAPVRERPHSPRPQGLAPAASNPPANTAPAVPVYRPEPSRPVAVPQEPMRRVDPPPRPDPGPRQEPMRRPDPPPNFDRPAPAPAPAPAPVSPPAGRDRGADPRQQSSRNFAPAPSVHADRGSSRPASFSGGNASGMGRSMGSSSSIGRGDGGSRGSSNGGGSRSSRR